MPTLQNEGQKFKQQFILQKAAFLLAHKPLQSVTMDEIAQNLGCGKATLYKYFKSKELLFVHIIQQKLNNFSQQLDTECMNNPDTLFAMQHGLEMLYHFFEENSQLFSSWMYCESNQEIKTALFSSIRLHMEEKSSRVETLLQRGIDEGFVQPGFDTHALTSIIETVFLSCVFSPLQSLHEGHPPHLSTLRYILYHGILTEQALARLPDSDTIHEAL